MFIRSVRSLIKSHVDTPVEESDLQVHVDAINAGLRQQRIDDGTMDTTFTWDYTIPSGTPKDVLIELVTLYKQTGWKVRVVGPSGSERLNFTPNNGWIDHIILFNQLP